MTWKQFKDAVEAKGVMDADEICCIDVDGFELDFRRVESPDLIVTWEADQGGWSIFL